MRAAILVGALFLLTSACGSSAPPQNFSGPVGSAQAGRGVDFRQMGLTGPVMNQAFVGSCSAFSAAAVMNSRLRRHGVYDSVSPMHVWAEMKLRHGMVQDLLNVAVAPAEAWPYDPVKACLIATPDDECAKAGYRPGSGQLDPAINLEWMRANLAERHRVIATEMVYSSSADSGATDKEVLFNLLASGEALDATILVGDGFYYPSGPVLSDYAIPDNRLGHGVALVGFRHAGGERQLLIQNSWGERWGEGGFVWMPERMVGRQLLNARRIQVVDARAPIPPARGQCDGWHHLDLVLDACYATCRNHAPTFNGRCNPMPKNNTTELACLDPREFLAGRCGPGALPLPLPSGWPQPTELLRWPIGQ